MSNLLFYINFQKFCFLFYDFLSWLDHINHNHEKRLSLLYKTKIIQLLYNQILLPLLRSFFISKITDSIDSGLKADKKKIIVQKLNSIVFMHSI